MPTPLPIPRDALRVLLLEDDEDDAILLENELGRQGFAPRIERVDTREEFTARLGPEVDLILSDHALPQFNAIEALELVRQRGLDIPFIIVSGAISEEVAVEAMRRGAADYLLKDRLARLGQAIHNALLERHHRLEKERAFEAIRRSEALNRSVLTSLQAHIAVLDGDGRIISTNEAWESFGQRKSSFALPRSGIDTNYLTVCGEAAERGDGFARKAMAGIRDVLRGRRSQFVMEYSCGSGGELQWFEMRVVPLVGGPHTGAVIAHTDITERKEAEEAVRESEERWRVLFETNPEATLISAQDVIEYGNPAFVRLVGAASMEALVGRSVVEFLVPEDRERLLSCLRRLEEGAAAEPREYRIQGPEGRERYIEAFSVPIVFRGRRVAQTVVRDLTERKHYEQQLIQEKERAEEMSRLKSTFLRNMSHEIRTPLTSILGFAEILADTAVDENREFARMIHKSGTRLMQTLNSVLDLAQLEGRVIQVRRAPLNLVQQVREAADLFEPGLREAWLTLTTHFPDRPVWVLADQAALGRVLNNLLSNAIKFTPRGGVTLTVEAADGYGQLLVQDTGVGIDRDFLPHLFQEFEQESSGIERDYEGVGLGLAISRRLVELMDGTIEAESEKGKGSTFIVRLPLHRPEPAGRGPAEK